MKRIVFFLITAPILLTSCGGDDDYNNNSVYKDYMRDFVISLSEYSKAKKSDFYIIPQNGHELVSENGDSEGKAHGEYNAAIDACGQEDLFYGYEDDDLFTPSEDKEYLCDLLDISKGVGNIILVTDYCFTQSKMEDSYSQNSIKGYISFAADERELNQIPSYPGTPNNVNTKSISDIADVKNFLYLINPENFATKAEFISAITSTNYDLLIMDFFFDDSVFTASEVQQLRSKANGGSRLVVSYMSIGEAEDYRFYWKNDWSTSPPEWLDEENPDWEGNYKVKYWNTGWQDIIFGSPDAYLDRIIEAGFDGVYLDIIEAFEYYE